jgi:hypothetical protein
MIGNYEGGFDVASPSKDWFEDLKHEANAWFVNKLDEVSDETEKKNEYAVDSRDVQLHYLYQAVKEDPTIENMNALQAELQMRTQVDQRFAQMFPVHMESVKNKSYPNPT